MNKLFTALFVLSLLCAPVFAQATDPANEFKAVGFNQKALFRVVNDLVTAANTHCLGDAAAGTGFGTGQPQAAGRERLTDGPGACVRIGIRRVHWRRNIASSASSLAREASSAGLSSSARR